MPDEQGAGAPHDDNQQQPTEGQRQDAGATTTPTTTTPEAKPDSANKLIKDFVSARGITVEELLTQITEREDADKTELERLTGERDTFKSRYEALEAKYRERTAESAFIEAATKANARAPKTLFRAYKSDLDFDDDGNVTNLADVIAKAQADEPDLFKSSTGRADNGQKGESATDALTMNDALRGLAKSVPR